MKTRLLTQFSTSIVIALFTFASSAIAQDISEESLRGGKPSKTASYVLQSWMHDDVGDAWASGYYGAGSKITFVDDFTSGSIFSGNLGTGYVQNTHGQWASLEASLVAPKAGIALHDFSDDSAISFDRRKMNILNLSYGMMAVDGYTDVVWSARENSIVGAARSGSAVIVKAAGNDYGIAVGDANSRGMKDYLNVDLIGAQSAIFVGALDANGSVENPAYIASYSNIAGDNRAVQEQFLVAGVESSKTGLRGTSFAAPIVSAYAAIVNNKFSKATATDITNRLLDTARTDTVANYAVNVHGQGEASLSRALAPNSIQ